MGDVHPPAVREEALPQVSCLKCAAVLAMVQITSPSFFAGVICYKFKSFLPSPPALLFLLALT